MSISGLCGATRRAPWRSCQPPQRAEEGFQKSPGEEGLGEDALGGVPKIDGEGSLYPVCVAGGVVGAAAGAPVQVGLMRVGCGDSAPGNHREEPAGTLWGQADIVPHFTDQSQELLNGSHSPNSGGKPRPAWPPCSADRPYSCFSPCLCSCWSLGLEHCSLDGPPGSSFRAQQ